jgi:hypothetical protein
VTEASAARDKALRAVRDFKQQFQEARKIHRGVLGHTDGSTVRVVERPDFVYVRIKALGGALWKVLNDKVSDIWNLPVLIEKVPVGDIWQVIDVDKSALLNVGSGWDGGAYLGPHAWTHEWPDKIPGPDAVDVYPRAIVPLRTYTRSYDGLYVTVLPYSYTYDGVYKEFLGTTMDISTYQPVSGKARYVMTYVDPRDNTLYGHPGPIRTYSAAIQLQAPSMPPYAIPSAIVRVWGDQMYVAENDIIDYRILLGMNVPDQAGSGVKGAAYVTMSYSGTLTNERLLTVGPGLNLADGGANAAAHITFATTYAPQTPAYITLTYHPDLPNERLLVAGTYINIADGGANAGATVSAQNLAPHSPQYVTLTYSPDLTAERMLVAGTNVTIVDQGPGKGVVVSAAGGGGGAPTDAEYVVISVDPTLTDERALAAGTGIAIVDGGAGGNVTISSTSAGDPFFHWGW